MCGITGSFHFSAVPASFEEVFRSSVASLAHRGPDAEGVYAHGPVHLGHRRLSIIDLSEAGRQPMTDASGRYTIVFNGEIYNFPLLRAALQKEGVAFRTATDTEVLLQAYKVWGRDCLQRLHGFFAFAIYDKVEESLFLARDRMGIKPLCWYADSNVFAFGSEMKALLALPLPKTLDAVSLGQYLQLNYIPAPFSLLQGYHHLLPGHALTVTRQGVEEWQWYTLPHQVTLSDTPASYEEAQYRLMDTLDLSVVERLTADVPLGAFLSGGIDSSVIVALASRHVERLHTFSVGFKDDPYHDETPYAQLVAKQFNTRHFPFYLSREELLRSLKGLLAQMDEPFADSSAILVRALSEKVRPYVTVALSGDGGDELFAGYRKHRAEWLVREGGIKAGLVKRLGPLWSVAPKARTGKAGNRFRQLHRFAEGARLSPQERYWRWCAFVGEQEAFRMLSPTWREQVAQSTWDNRKQYYTKWIEQGYDLNEVCYADIQLVLPNDMLRKVDLMSMSQGLEVRVPFLDHRVAEFAFSLPESFKINKDMQKRLVQDTFRDLLPPELYNRPKQGFEVPLLSFMRKELKGYLLDGLLDKDKLAAQGILEVAVVEKLKRQLMSRSPGDAPARLYGLMVLQESLGKMGW